MSFTTFTNVITILFCFAVLVQSVRMMRSLKQMREGKLDQTVLAMDNATAQARSVLSGLRETLSIEGPANSRVLNEAREIREELNVMIGIANAMAERLIDAASSKPQSDGVKVDAQPVKPAKKARATRLSRAREQLAKTAEQASAKKPDKPIAARKADGRTLRVVEVETTEEVQPALAKPARKAA